MRHYLAWARSQVSRLYRRRRPNATQPYAAFISYSHAADGRLAPSVQSGLQSFAKPWYARRAVRIFCDETNLSVRPDLWATIETALVGAEYFLLLSSPEAAVSKWVRREVMFWRQHRSPENLLLVLTGGHLVWDLVREDFDWDATDAVPPELKGFFAREPLHVDLRWARTADDLSLANGRFTECIARISSTLRNIEMDELIGEDVRQHARRKQIARGVIATLSALRSC